VLQRPRAPPSAVFFDNPDGAGLPATSPPTARPPPPQRLQLGLTDQPILTNTKDPLPAVQAYSLLRECKSYTNTVISFFDAKGGDVFLYKAATHQQAQDWRQGSRYRFLQMNGGQSNVLGKDGTEGMKRVVGRVVTAEKKGGDKGFRRIAWFFPSSPTITLLQVSGLWFLVSVSGHGFWSLKMKG
jgi:hypothetical protein